MSTDFDIADKMYFEPLTPEDVESIVDIEKPDGAVVQFGGQTAIKLTEALMKMGVPILGTAAEDVDAAEDRERFDEILEQCGIPRPAGHTVFTAEEAKRAAHDLGYPVLVRPSYVPVSYTHLDVYKRQHHTRAAINIYMDGTAHPIHPGNTGRDNPIIHPS